MWETEQQEFARDERVRGLQRQDGKLLAAGIPLDLMERTRRATRHCQGDMKGWRTPPTEIYCQDCAGTTLRRTIELRDMLGVTNQWLMAIAKHASSLGRAQLERCVSIDLSGTSISDAGVAAIVSTLKHVATLNVSRCASLTDDSPTAIRRYLSRRLQELHIDECRRFTSDVLCQLWKDCSQLHTLSASGCPGVTDRFLQCIASSPRSPPGCRVRSLDILQCKHVTSSGIAYLAAANVHVALEHLRCGDCMGIEPTAFFGFEDSEALRLSLTTLDLRGLDVGIDETAISWIAKGCAAAPNFARLNLSRCSQVTDFALLLLAPVVALPNFLKLNLEECVGISDRGIQDLFSGATAATRSSDTEHSDEEEDAGPSVQLRILNLRNCVKVGDTAMEAIGSRCPHLVKLNLKGLRKVSDRGILSIAKGCPSMAKLVLSGRYITTPTFAVLGKMCRRLETLDVSERSDLDSPACFLYLTSTPTCGRSAFRTPDTSLLRCIDLSATNCCDAGINMVAVACRCLEWINLSKCSKVTDVAVEALAACCVKLRVLLIAHVRGVTDRSLAACATARLPLRVLDLSGNTNVTDDGLLQLSAACQLMLDVRLHGCDRLSPKVAKHCNTALLPFTRPFSAASLIKTIATGGGNVALSLAGLPASHVAVLSQLELQYRSAAALQAKFRKWRQTHFSVQFLARRRLLRESRAAKKIQRCVRDFLAWRRFLHLLQIGRNVEIVVYVQAHARGCLDRHAVRVKKMREHRAARTIQRGFRPHHVRRMRVRNFHAREIQRVYRGFCARQLHKQLVWERQAAAATRIATWNRKYRRQQNMKARSRWLLCKIRSIQGQWRVYRQRKRFWEHAAFYRQRAVAIQSAWRRKLAIALVRTMRVCMNAAALTIQRVFRGHRARKWTRHHRATGNRCACVIQSQWRRFIMQRAYVRAHACIVQIQRMARYALVVRRLRRVARGAVELHRHHAAISIQRVYRGHLGRRRAVLFRRIRSAKAARRGQNAAQALLRRQLVAKGAALRIQEWVRSILARRRMLKLRRWKRFVASSCIQRYLKRWMQRLRVHRRREAHAHAATHVERVYRGHRGRRAFRRAKHEQRCQNAALIIQRVYRGHRGRREFRRIHQASHAAARTVQRAFRGRQARKLYEISLAVRALRAKEQHDKSLLGWIDAKRHPMDELYRRARLPREKAVLESIRRKWVAHREAEERSLRKLQRACHAADSCGSGNSNDGSLWQQANEAVENDLAARRKLYGVTENVYTTYQELLERQTRRTDLSNQLDDLRTRISAFKCALREASTSRRMLEGVEVAELLRQHGLLAEAAPTGGN